MTEPASKALGLFNDLPPFALWTEAGEPWCLPVLRTESALRLKGPYISETGQFFDEGVVPPGDLDEDVERAALAAHGIDTSAEWIAAYRFAARFLPKEQREEIFFLKTNDQMFRPKVDLLGRKLEGMLITVERGGGGVQWTSFQEVLLAHPRTVLVASTSS